MLLLWNEFELKHPDEKRFDRLLDTYYDTFKKLQRNVEAKPETAAEKRILEKAAEKAVSEFKSWWAVELEANKYEETDMDKADEIYREGLKKFPDEPKLLCNYAIFLTDIRKDHDKAEEYYKKAFEVDPNHANNLGNYAGFLLARGKQEEGDSFLQKALSSADEQTPVALECLFYQYAHTRDRKVQDESLAEIRELLKSGVRSPSWNLKDNVTRAVEDGHPDPEFLDKLSKVISEEIELQELEGDDIWSKISQI